MQKKKTGNTHFLAHEGNGSKVHARKERADSELADPNLNEPDHPVLLLRCSRRGRHPQLKTVIVIINARTELDHSVICKDGSKGSQIESFIVLTLSPPAPQIVDDDDDETFRKRRAAQGESPDKRNTNWYKKTPRLTLSASLSEQLFTNVGISSPDPAGRYRLGEGIL